MTRSPASHLRSSHTRTSWLGNGTYASRRLCGRHVLSPRLCELYNQKLSFTPALTPRTSQLAQERHLRSQACLCQARLVGCESCTTRSPASPLALTLRAHQLAQERHLCSWASLRQHFVWLLHKRQTAGLAVPCLQTVRQRSAAVGHLSAEHLVTQGADACETLAMKRPACIF